MLLGCGSGTYERVFFGGGIGTWNAVFFCPVLLWCGLGDGLEEKGRECATRRPLGARAMYGAGYNARGLAAIAKCRMVVKKKVPRALTCEVGGRTAPHAPTYCSS